MKLWPIALAGAAVVTMAAIALRGRKATGTGPLGNDEDEGGDAPPDGGHVNAPKVKKPIAVGEIGDPAVVPLVAQIQLLWDQKGIPHDVIVPAQFYTMSKAPHVDGPDPDHSAGPILAIPDYDTWEHTSDFLAKVVVPLFAEVERRGGKREDYRTGGYRAADYNAAVGGAGDSQHTHADALDIIPLRHVTTNTDILLMSIATIMLTHPSLPIGGGFYAGNGHIDLPENKTHQRHWSGKTVSGKAEKYLDRAKKELAIA